MTCQITVDSTDGEVSAFYNAKIVTARKEYTCVECKKAILPGQQYERAIGKWCGRIETVRTCGICLEVRREFFCTWVHGCMWADFEVAVEEEDFDLSHLDKLSKAAIDAVSEHLSAE